jgi:hypothetical protein
MIAFTNDDQRSQDIRRKLGEYVQFLMRQQETIDEADEGTDPATH